LANLEKILLEVIDDAISIGFPVSKNLERKIYIDKARYDRVGACYRYSLPERYEIHISERAKYANVKAIKSIIAHEVLHAYFLTMEHNNFWEVYRKRMNDRFGYNIKIKYSWEEIF
jgi:predicted metal-dependent hydrolase